MYVTYIYIHIHVYIYMYIYIYIWVRIKIPFPKKCNNSCLHGAPLLTDFIQDSAL